MAHSPEGMVPLVCNHVEDMKKFDPQVHGLVIFDDLQILRPDGTSIFDHEDIIHLIDRSTTASMPARFQDVTFPKGLMRIFTTNNAAGIVPQNASEEHKMAIRRRIVHFTFESPLFGPVAPGAIPPQVNRVLAFGV